MNPRDSQGGGAGRVAAFLSRNGSILVLAAANIYVAFPAAGNEWPLAELMWVYWAQSVIIGLVHVLNILAVGDYEVGDFKIFGQPVGKTVGARVNLGFMFLLHYGFMHFAYLFILASHFRVKPTEFDGFLSSSALFAAAHLFSFIRQRRALASARPTLTMLFFFPYIRVIPMHFTILLGFGAAGIFFGREVALPATILFILLKTAVDLAMQRLESSRLWIG